MNTLKDIEAFTSQKNFAVVGVSENKRKFGNMLFKEFKKRNLNVVPINHHLDMFEGEKCYKSIDELPTEISALIIVTKKNETTKLIDEAIQKGIKHIWVQQGAEPDNFQELTQFQNANIITKQCALMHTHPIGIHKFHGKLNKFFGVGPK